MQYASGEENSYRASESESRCGIREQAKLDRSVGRFAFGVHSFVFVHACLVCECERRGRDRRSGRIERRGRIAAIAAADRLVEYDARLRWRCGCSIGEMQKCQRYRNGNSSGDDGGSDDDGREWGRGDEGGDVKKVRGTVVPLAQDKQLFILLSLLLLL